MRVDALLTFPGWRLRPRLAWVLLVLVADLAQSCAAAASEPISLVSVVEDKQALNRPHDVELQGELAFVPGKGGSLAIVDVSDLKQPRVVWSRGAGREFEDAQTVLLNGPHLYVGARDFFALDIRQPRQTAILERISDRPRIDAINGMVRRGDYLLTANKTGWIALFDIRQPEKPRYHGSFSTRAVGNVRSPHDIDLYGDYVAIVDQSHQAPVKVRLYQVADLQTHELLPCDAWQPAGAVTTADLNGANRIQIAGDHAFVACSQRENFTIGMIDLRDPQQPRHLKTLPYENQFATGLTVAGRVLFVGGGQGVQAIDVSNPAEPVTLATFKSREAFPAGGSSVHDLVYRDGLLFAAAQNDYRLAILRVNDPRILKLAADR